MLYCKFIEWLILKDLYKFHKSVVSAKFVLHGSSYIDKHAVCMHMCVCVHVCVLVCVCMCLHA